MRKYCQEYLTYCAAPKKTPDEMMLHDEKEYPGGCTGAAPCGADRR